MQSARFSFDMASIWVLTITIALAGIAFIPSATIPFIYTKVSILALGGLIALADAGASPGSGGPRDPESMFGLSKVVNAGVQNVVLGVNVQLIRKHPVGARMGPVLQALPQWRDFLKGAQTPVDPIRDTDWILIYGPSLIHTDKDAVLVRYTARQLMSVS